MKKYRLVDHTADMGMEISGRTKKELFSNAALALFDLLIEHKNNHRIEDRQLKGKQKKITVEGMDIADLLINFLRELLYLFHGETLVVSGCKISKCTTKRVVAHLLVQKYNDTKYEMKTEIKAATYHNLKVEKHKTNWKARIIFDV